MSATDASTKENLLQANTYPALTPIKAKRRVKPVAVTPVQKPRRAKPKKSPMTIVMQRKPTAQKIVGTLYLVGPFVRDRDELEATFQRLHYRIVPALTKATTFVICNEPHASHAVLQQASQWGIPILTEASLFTQPAEAETESDEDRLEIDEESFSLDSDGEEILLRLDSDSEESLLTEDIPTLVEDGKRLDNACIALIGELSTPYIILKQHIVSQGGRVTALQDLVQPATHVVLSAGCGTRAEFLRKYVSFWWLRSAVFLDEAELLRICAGEEKLVMPKARQPVELQTSMRRLSLTHECESTSSEMSLQARKRKARPPTTPKKVKPLFCFNESPDRKRGRTASDNQIQSIQNFQFTSAEPLGVGQVERKFRCPKAGTEGDISQSSLPEAKPIPMLPLSASQPAIFSSNSALEISSVPIESTTLEGKRFVLLGKFKKTKKRITQLIFAHSGELPKSAHLSAKVSYLLCGAGSENTAKYKKAVEKGIPILTEEQFLAMLP